MRNNTYSDVLGEGKCKFLVNGSVIVPSIHTNLMSVPILEKNGYEVKFKFENVFFKKRDVLVKGVRVDDVYILQIDDKIPISNYLNVLTEKNSSCLWNLKLSDINKYKIIRMSSSGLIQ